MQLLAEFINNAIQIEVSQLYFSVGRVVSYKDAEGQLIPLYDTVALTTDNMKALVNQAIVEPKDKEILQKLGEVEAILSAPGKFRSRVNVYLQRGTYAMTITILTMEIEPIIPINEWGFDLDSILTKPEGGLCIITGHSDTDKLAASLVDYFNTNHKCHIVTLEDNVTTLHRHKNAIVNQLVLSSKNPNRTVLRLKNIGADVCIIVSKENEKLLSEIAQIAMSGIFVVAVFNKNSLDALKESIIANVEPHEWDELSKRLKKCLKLCIDLDSKTVTEEWLT